MAQSHKPRLVVVGNGMVGHRFLEVLAQAGLSSQFDVTVFGEERRAAYDRVHLSAFFEGRTDEELSLLQPGQYEVEGFPWRPARITSRSVLGTRRFMEWFPTIWCG